MGKPNKFIPLHPVTIPKLRISFASVRDASSECEDCRAFRGGKFAEFDFYALLCTPIGEFSFELLHVI